MSHLFQGNPLSRVTAQKLGFGSPPKTSAENSSQANSLDSTSADTLSSSHSHLSAQPSTHAGSDAQSSSPLPYQPRRRTPGGSTSSIPTTSSLMNASSSINSSITNNSHSGTGGMPLFSNPVRPTTSTSQVETTDIAVTSGATGKKSDGLTGVDSKALSGAENGTVIGAGAGAGAIVRSNSGSTGRGSLTGRLQLTNLKAEAQRGLGLGNDSLGMKMLETLVAKGGEKPWEEVIDLVLVKKATLLLPLASPLIAIGTTDITPEVFKEHIVFCNGGANDSTLVVTLGGFIGRMDSSILTFGSFISTDGPIMSSLIDPSTRSQTLSQLSYPYVHPSLSDKQFPTLTVLHSSGNLPFPPPAPAVPTPTVPMNSAAKGRTSLLGSAPRNPFASLFSRPKADVLPTSSSEPQTLSPKPPTITLRDVDAESESKSETGSIHRYSSSVSLKDPLAQPGSPSPSVERAQSPSPSIDGDVKPKSTEKKEEIVFISAWGVDRAIKKTEIEKAIGMGTRGWVEIALSGLPTGVISGVQRFISMPHPSAAQPRSHSLQSPISSKSRSRPSTSLPTLSTITAPVSYSDPEACSSVYQSFSSLVHDELYAYFSADIPSIEPGGENEEKREKEREKKEREIEKIVLEGVDKVEEVVMSCHYNLLFSPSKATDSKHDEALASRIAALNMLDLTLDHLGVVTIEEKETADRNETVRKGLNDIVRAVGAEFQKLQSPSHQSPKQKALVLVRAHKIVIDGLRGLPPIRLRPEDEELPAHLKKSTSGSSPVVPGSPKSSSDDTTSTTSLPRAKDIDPPVSAPITENKLSAVSNHEFISPLGSPPDKISAARSSSQDSYLRSPLEEAMSESMLAPPAPQSSDSPCVTSEQEVYTKPPEETQPTNEETTPTGSGSSGADLLLPVIIYSVVKSNPARLVSDLLYVQRYRSSMSISGESSYALVNTTAVVDFLENVDFKSLGLGDSGRVLSADFPPVDPELNKDLGILTAQPGVRTRGRARTVGELATTGLNNVVDSGLGAFRTLLGSGQVAAEGLMAQVPGAPSIGRPGLQGRSFSIASLTASVAGIGAKDRIERLRESSISKANQEWGPKREMVDVSSRPVSILDKGEDSDDAAVESPEASLSDDQDDDDSSPWRKDGDARSMRSVSSFKSFASKAEGPLQPAPTDRGERMSISQRFARLATGGDRPNDQVLSASLPKATPFYSIPSPSDPKSSVASLDRATRLSTPSEPKADLLNNALDSLSPSTSLPRPTLAGRQPSTGSIASAGVHTPPIAAQRLLESGGSVSPPVERFLNVHDVGELKVGELAELLKDYRRLAKVLQEVGVWD